MIRSRGYGDEPRVGAGNVALTMIVVGMSATPCDDGPVGLEAQAVFVTRGDRYEARIRCRNGALAIVKRTCAAPGPNGAVRFEAQAVTLASRDGDETRIRCGDVNLTVRVASPRQN